MIIEVHSDVAFSFQPKGKYKSPVHLLTIWEEAGGYIEVNMTDEELEDLRDTIK